MHRFERERLQNKHVQSPLQDLPWPIRHRSPLFLYSYWHPSGAYACPTGCQEETLRYGCNSQAGIPAPVSVKPAELTQFLDEVGVYQVLKGKLVAIEPEIVNRRTGTRCSILGGKPVKPTASQGFWSGRWESNPRPKLGKLLYCHCTTPAD